MAQIGSYIGWILWGALMTGAGLVLLGLFRNTGRFRQWQHLRGAGDGDLVPGDRALAAGQAAKITLPDRDSEPLAATLIEVGKRSLRLHLEAEEGEARRFLPIPPVGATITVTTTGQGALYRFETCVQDAPPRFPAYGAAVVAVRRPLWLSRIQRRQHVRAPVALPATFDPGESLAPGGISPHFPLHGTVVDLSGGGVKADIGGPLGAKDAAELSALLRPGTILRIRLPLPALSAPLLARVQSGERAAIRGGLTVRVACAFLPMNSWEQELLISHVFRVQRGVKY